MKESYRSRKMIELSNILTVFNKMCDPVIQLTASRREIEIGREKDVYLITAV